MIGLIIITVLILLLVNTDASKGNAGERFIASIITLADMGFLAWLMC